MRDFVRSALFNIIADFVVDSSFLDLFCGTGSVGLEALSRGASMATFVDQSAKACSIVRRNLDLLGFLDRGSVLERDYVVGIDYLERRGKRYNLVFVGPPYDRGLAEACLQILAQSSVVHPNGLIVTETRNKTRLEAKYGNLGQIDKRTYGDNSLFFYQPSKQFTTKL
jgi:16S rRNA (guanine966-N2)-methyltransferase